MARTKVNGVEKGRPGLDKRKTSEDETEKLEEEQPKRRKVIKVNQVYHVSEWVPEIEAVSGEPAKGNSTIPVKLKEITRLETPEEREERKAAYAESKRIAIAEKLKFWLETVHPWLEIRAHRPSLGQSIKYLVSPNCLLRFVPYERIVNTPQVFVSCVEVLRKNVSSDKKVYLVVGMLVELFSNTVGPVLLHSIIMHQEAPHR